MRDTISPMRDEIRDWAFTADALEPEQDWDLHLSHLPHFDLFVELAADDDCPKWAYFLRLLYFIVGDGVRTQFRTEDRQTILKLLSDTNRFPRHRFHIFRTRSEQLLSSPDTFDYDDWCGGLLVSNDLTST